MKSNLTTEYLKRTLFWPVRTTAPSITLDQRQCNTPMLRAPQLSSQISPCDKSNSNQSRTGESMAKEQNVGRDGLTLC